MKRDPTYNDARFLAVDRIGDRVRSRARCVFSGNYDDPAIQKHVISCANHYVSGLTGLLKKQFASARARRRQVFHILGSFDARLCALIMSWKGEPITLQDACNLVKDLSPRKDCGEAVHFYRLKKPEGGDRPIWSFGPKRRCLQRLVTDILRVIWGPPGVDFACEGRGRHAAIEKLMAHTEKKGGARWYLTADIKNCFGSFDQGMLINLIPLPESVVRNCILVPEGTTILTKHTNSTSSKAVLQGLPQGSLASFYIATKLLEPALLQLHGEVVISHADDIAVGCKTKKEVEANKLLLGDLLRDHPAGPLFMTSSIAALGSPIDYLGYRLRRRWTQYGGGVRLTPSGKAFLRFEKRLAAKLRVAPSGQLDEVAAGYVRDWCLANRLWDRSEAGDTLFYITTWHILSGIRSEKIKSKPMHPH